MKHFLRIIIIVYISICCSTILKSCKKVTLPTVTTNPVTNIAATSATSGGNVTNNGGAEVTSRGVCWSTTKNPEINSNPNMTTDGTGNGSFSSSITGLSANVSYHIRAYATNRYGSIINAIPYQVTGNGDTPVNVTLRGLMPDTRYYYRVTATNCAGTTNAIGKDFTTPPLNTLTDYDGNTYNVIAIGTQVWMSENLKTTTYKDGTPVTLVTNDIQWMNLTSEAYCWYDNNVTYKNTYGALYNWYAVNTGKLCPTAWHVPTDAEWTLMENFLIANGFNYDGSTTVNKIAKSLASTNNWNSSTNIGAVGNTDFSGKRNVTGFTALPSGYRISDGSFSDIRNFDGWWSFTESNTTLAWSRNIYYDYNYTYRDQDPKRVGFSVRCIKD